MNKRVIALTLFSSACVFAFLSLTAFALAAGVPSYPAHYHANFAVFVNNEKVNFAQPSLMHLKPCKDGDDPAFHPREENIHLHDMVGNVAHVHQEGLTWAELFKNLKFDFALNESKYNRKFVFYLNDKITQSDVLQKAVNKNDRLLVTMDGGDIVEQLQAVGSNAHEYDIPGRSNESCSGQNKRSWQTRLRISLLPLLSR